MLRSSDKEVWIKGWFDGDYSAIPGTGQLSGTDTETTHVQVTRGRFTSIQRVSGPPEVQTSGRRLRQEVVPEVHLQPSEGEGWITSVQDLHIVDWEDDSTAGVLSGGAQRVGRVVGWAFARVSDPTLNPPKKKMTLPTPETSTSKNSPDTQAKPTNSDGSSSEATNGGGANNPERKESPAQKEAPPDPPKNLESPAPGISPHPCWVCSWGSALLVFFIVWIVCTLWWAFLAVAPLLIRCVLARVLKPSWLVSELRHLAEFSLLLILGAGAFAHVLWRTMVDCGDTPVLSLAILFTTVCLSARTRFCWLINLLGWIWLMAILMTCPVQDRACFRNMELGTATNQTLSNIQNKLDQFFRPDRDAQDVSGKSSMADGWVRISLDEAEKRPEKFFTCVEKSNRRRENYVIYMGESALFDLNSAALNEAAEPQIMRLGKLIQKHQQSHLIVIGHSDKSPHRDGPEGNLALSEKRAYSVVDWLLNGGYAKPDYIVAMGAGDRYPLFDTLGEFRGNRRVEVRVICPGAKR